MFSFLSVLEIKYKFIAFYVVLCCIAKSIVFTQGLKYILSSFIYVDITYFCMLIARMFQNSYQFSDYYNNLLVLFSLIFESHEVFPVHSKSLTKLERCQY